MEDLFRREVIDRKRERLNGEVVISQTPSIKIVVTLITLACLIACAWLLPSKYARTESAPGVLMTTLPSLKVVTPVSGTIVALSVREGAEIRQGDPLATIAIDRQSEAGTAAAGVGLATIEARIALNAQDSAAIASKHASERRGLQVTAASAAEQLIKLDTQIALQKELVASSKLLYERIAEVVKSGFVSNVEFERRHQQLIGAQQSLAGMMQQRIALQAQIEQAKSQLAEAGSQHLHDSLTVASSRELLKQQRAEFEGARSYVLKAPISGRVSSLQASTGSVAAANAPLLTIVPHNTPLKAEAFIVSRAVGFARPGQEVRLLYDAFPYQRFGSFKGTIVAVSKTIIDPRESLLPVKVDQPVYKVEIRLDRQDVAAYGERIPLQPGMELTANIILDRQTFLSWILAPFTAVKNRS